MRRVPGFLEKYINPERFGVTFDRSLVNRKAAGLIGSWLGGLGKERIEFLISNNTDLESVITPQALELVKKEVEQYSWAKKWLYVSGIWKFLDQEVKGMILSSPGGEEWAKRQLIYLRNALFGGKNEP